MGKPFLAIDAPEETTASPHKEVSRETPNAAAQMLGLALRALSQRAVIALSSLFTGAGLFAVFWLFQAILPDPSDRQLIGASLFALFFLALELVRRRR